MAHEHAKPGEVIDLNVFGETKSTALVKEKKFEVIRLFVEPGKPIPPHQVDGPVTVQCLSGKCPFFVADQPRELEPGSWLYVAGGTRGSMCGLHDAHQWQSTAGMFGTGRLHTP